MRVLGNHPQENQIERLLEQDKDLVRHLNQLIDTYRQLRTAPQKSTFHLTIRDGTVDGAFVNPVGYAA